MKNRLKHTLFLLVLLVFGSELTAQIKIKGEVYEANSKEPAIGATVQVVGTENGATTEYDGTFQISVPSLPVTLKISYIGFKEVSITVTDNKNLIKINLEEDAVLVEEVKVVGQRISDKQKQAPLTIESLDAIAIKQTASTDFYNALGSLKGVDLTTASIGFTIINTRGFNSTSPVRSLQIIDGVDNQSPGLNFSLGNFLGAPELDIQKVDLVVGASSAFYGPNAFNGVISMETKNPFYNKGLSASFKVGERNLFEGALRYADAFKNKKGEDAFAFKVNLFGMRALDWSADNDESVFNTADDNLNPGGYNKVNTYGDEYSITLDYSGATLFSEYAGLGRFYRTGYKESDVVNYGSRNFKGNVGMTYRLKPSQKELSPELSYGFNLGNGTTVYQGDNRFSLKNILFYQNKLELKKRDKYFLRMYSTQEDAGDSYDPYFTALVLTDKAKDNVNWASDYVRYWQDNVKPNMVSKGYPVLKINVDPNTGFFTTSFDSTSAKNWLKNNKSFLTEAHGQARTFADNTVTSTRNFKYLSPDSPEFNAAFNEVVSRKSSKKQGANSGTRFFDKSALIHFAGEYKLNPKVFDEVTVGGSFRTYRPNSEGTIFSDTGSVKIRNNEFGLYAGFEERLDNSKWKINGTLRADKNQNFNLLFSPAVSAVYTPTDNNFFRLSFSSAIRNPTLTDQYLFLNVGPAILSGNLSGVERLITVPSFRSYLENFDRKKLSYFDIDGVRPEKVKSLEFGYRTSLFNSTFIDASIYASQYTDFLGFVIALKSDFDATTGLPQNTQAYRFTTNSRNKVNTTGLSIGVSQYLWQFYQLNGNYSFNKLQKLDEDDPIIPAFNTPEHKFNIGFSGRDLLIGKVNKLGFNVNYKWVDEFIFEGSPQFTGNIPQYALVDAQVNYALVNSNLTFKLGATNILNNKVYQTYGGPRIGRLAYVSALYEFKKK
jgi:iron complex outermembrane recepter protein